VTLFWSRFRTILHCSLPSSDVIDIIVLFFSSPVHAISLRIHLSSIELASSHLLDCFSLRVTRALLLTPLPTARRTSQVYTTASALLSPRRGFFVTSRFRSLQTRYASTTSTAVYQRALCPLCLLAVGLSILAAPSPAFPAMAC
jgi:hypothetical protein